MVRIRLRNMLKQAPEKKVVLDLASQTCLINDNQEISLQAFWQLQFSHPLLNHPVLQLQDKVYTYSYDNLEQLTRAARLVYATLLKAPEPMACVFHIKPSKLYEPLRERYRIPLSLDSHKTAKEYIEVNQLNSIISYYLQEPFQYQDYLVINQRFSAQELPEEVDGNALFAKPKLNSACINQADDFSNYELRYINRHIGFGVFARRNFAKDVVVCVYCGLKTTVQPELSNYYFVSQEDALNMGVDARTHGNISRFFNHAPDTAQEKSTLIANIDASSRTLNGIAFVVFTTKGPIKKGEQLVVDYGDSYWQGQPCHVFNRKDRHKIMKETYNQRIPMLRVMARYGVKAAQFELYQRALIAVVCSAIALLVIKYTLA